MSSTTSSNDIGSAFDLLGKSWKLVKENWQLYLAVNILSILSAFSAFAPDSTKKSNDEEWMNFTSSFNNLSGYELGSILGLGILVGIIFAIISIFLYAMLVSLQTKNGRGERPTLKELFDDGKRFFFPLLGLMILSVLIVGVGLILLIVPGVIALGRVIMAPYVMFDQKLGVMDSLKESNRIGKTYPGKVWAAIGVLILISIGAGIIGAVPLIGSLLGTLVTIAFSLVIALRYFQLKKLQVASSPPPKTTPKKIET